MLTEAFDALQNLLTMVLTPRKTDELDWNRDIPDVKNCEKFSIVTNYVGVRVTYRPG